jgi:AraC-like DNA-binding protein
MSLVMIKLPIERLITRIPAPETLVGVALRASRGETALAANMLLGMKRAFSLHPGEQWDDAASDVILDVLALACGGAAEASSEPRGEGGRRDAMAYIERHLTDPGLGVADIAAGVGVSVRQLQRLFIETGTAPRQYLLERRLDAAAALLRRGEEGGASITDVALGVGFNDLSYFSRTFTHRHGVSPRAYRRRWARS